jgi:hypothetical protein
MDDLRDFSIAAYDNVKMAITVGRVAAKNPAFVNPHRVLGSGGADFIRVGPATGSRAAAARCPRARRRG